MATNLADTPYLREDSLDDLLQGVIDSLLKRGASVKGHRGQTREISGVLLHLKNPRARVSQTENRGHLFSSLGELLWLLAQSNSLDFIRYYVKKYEDETDDGKTIYGAYGPRFFNMHGNINQVRNIEGLLRESPGSRRAVIQVYDARDNDFTERRKKEIPCTCHLQFFVRDERLHALAHMRSNDAYIGLPHDVFVFTMFQELLARALGVELGEYKHAVGSLHLYEDDFDDAKAYLGLGWQKHVEMPETPKGNPWPVVERMLVAERELRESGDTRVDEGFDPYWADVVLLLRVWRAYRQRDEEMLARLREKFVAAMYQPFVDQKIAAVQDRKRAGQGQ